MAAGFFAVTTLAYAVEFDRQRLESYLDTEAARLMNVSSHPGTTNVSIS